jgi:regulator of replication initiation timing
VVALEIFMELIYSAQKSDFDPQKRYRNPEHFERPEAGVTSVLVVGDWPNVVDAYENVGVELTLKEAAPRHVLVVGAGNNQTELEELIGKLRIESDMVRTVIDGLDAGEIEKPEAGELAIRLFQTLDGIRLQMAELAGARDDLATENETLRHELAELKADEGQEVEALKAKLDVAGVSYRANASKESLEKLVADLSKA